MSYLGRRTGNAPLNSADIPADIVEGTDIAYLENDSTTQYLGGTYSTERMYLNDSYTLNDNVTITGHLALGTIADSDVVITNDSSTRTITGSGTLEAGRLMNDTPSLTGMTGELGSAVTGNTAITGVGTLTSGNFDTVFPFTTATASSVTREHFTIGKLKIMIVRLTSDASGHDWGSGNMPRYYNAGSFTYPAFSSRPSIWAIQETGAHDCVVSGVYNITTTGADWISASESRIGSLESTAHTFLIIGEA